MYDTESNDTPCERDPHLDVEGPLFYSLPQSVRDGLVAHFLQSFQEQGGDLSATGREMLMAA